MRSPINANVLLKEVINVLKQDLLPSVTPDNKYNLLMCINALEITLRSLDENNSELDSYHERLAMMSQAIQSGEYDNAQADNYRQLLEKLTRFNETDLLVSNPKFIKSSMN